MKIEPQFYDRMTQPERRALRERYVEAQNNLCLYCSRSLNKPATKRKLWINWKLFPPNFLRYPVHLHHDHKTGLTLGAVHAYCNAALWMQGE